MPHPPCDRVTLYNVDALCSKNVRVLCLMLIQLLPDWPTLLWCSALVIVFAGRWMWPCGLAPKVGALREMFRPSGMNPISPAPAPPCALPESGPEPGSADGPRRAERFGPLAAIARLPDGGLVHAACCAGRGATHAGRRQLRRGRPNSQERFPVPPETRIAQRRHGLPDATLPFHLGPTDPLQPCARAIVPPRRGVFNT